MNIAELSTIVGAVGVFLGAIVAWRKFGPETVNMNVNAAQVNVSTSLELMERLEGEVTRISGEMDELRSELRTVLEERDRYKASSEAWKVKALDSEAEVRTLKRRVVKLEAQVRRLEHDAHQ
jgi:uncharacterized coiled-coil DUF342 family protein